VTNENHLSPAPFNSKEAWIAQELTENETLSDVQKQTLFSKLDKDIRSQLEAAGYDDFDLVYVRLLQLGKQKIKSQ